MATYLIYDLGMRALLVLPALLAPILAAADVYKWEGPDGRIHYSDRPVTGSEHLDIRVDPSAETSDSQGPSSDSQADPGPYEGFEIANPQPNQTLRDAEGKIELSLLIDPPLSKEHRVQIRMDDQPISGDSRETQLLLRGLGFGSHRVQAVILDDQGEIIASTPVVHFHLRKPLPEDADS